MKNRFGRNILISAAIHIVIITVLLICAIVSCQRRRAPREITTFVDLQVLPPELTMPSVVTPEKTSKPVKKEPEQHKKKMTVSKKLVRRPGPSERKKLSADEIKKALGKIVPLPSRNADSSEIAFARYLSLIRTIMYKSWEQPGALSGKKGLVTTVLIRVHRNGEIVQQKIIQSSGNVLMDTSVIEAVESVKRLPELPRGFGDKYKDITIDFELTETIL